MAWLWKVRPGWRPYWIARESPTSPWWLVARYQRDYEYYSVIAKVEDRRIRREQHSVFGYGFSELCSDGVVAVVDYQHTLERFGTHGNYQASIPSGQRMGSVKSLACAEDLVAVTTETQLVGFKARDLVLAFALGPEPPEPPKPPKSPKKR